VVAPPPLAAATPSVVISNTPPAAWTDGPRFVPVGSASDRQFLWSAQDADDDPLQTTVDCGSGAVTATGDWIIEGVHTLRCTFDTAGDTLVGVRSTDDQGATTDGRTLVRATSLVRSIADGDPVIDGIAGDDQLGGALATPDLNGDGIADIAIGGTSTSNGPGNDAGYVMVVFGPVGTGSIDLGDLPDGAGFRIDGDVGVGFGRALADAGDLNDDGFDDLLIGAAEGAGPGIVHVVFGADASDDIDVDAPPADRVATITGAEAGGLTGRAVAGIGDADGDGIDDVLIGSPGLDGGDGGAHLVFGLEAFTDIDLGALTPDRGIHIQTTGPDTGASVAGGDVNGDGRTDAIVGSRNSLESNATVVYGATDMSDLDGATMDADEGFVIGGDEDLGILSVVAGDMDGDGFDEVAVAHPYWDDSSKWAVSIIRGAAANADIPALASASSARLVRVLPAEDEIGDAMTTTDWNKDGRADLVVGGAYSGQNGEGSGSAYLIKGTATLSTVRLGTLDPRWLRIDGDNAFAWAGDGVAGGDVTGDGYADLLVGAPGAIDWDASSLPGRVGVFAGAKADTKAPTAAPPTTKVRKTTLDGGRPVIRLRWSGSDGGSGIDSYEVARQTDDGAWATIGATATGTLDVVLATGHEYQFRVRAIDRSGNRSNWAYGPTQRLIGYQETSSRIAYRGSWRTATGPSYAGGATKFASREGKQATLTFTGRQVAFAAPTGPSRGRARVYVNGGFVGTISLYAATAGPSRILGRWSWSTSARRTITIRVVGTSGHPRIDVDRFIVIR
jgi:hypothetical protein